MYDLTEISSSDESFARFLMAHAMDDPTDILTGITQAVASQVPDDDTALEPVMCRTVSLLVGLCYLQQALRTDQADIGATAYLIALFADNTAHAAEHGHPLAESLVEDASTISEAYLMVVDWAFDLAPVIVDDYVPSWL